MQIIKAENLTNETMNIYAKHGDKVIFANPDNGSSFDQADCGYRLRLNKVYTVDRVDVGQSRSYVWLQEVSGACFNTVMFDGVE